MIRIHQAKSITCNQIPYATEQGIFATLMGKRFVGTGNFFRLNSDFRTSISTLILGKEIGFVLRKDLERLQRRRMASSMKIVCAICRQMTAS
jgi:hypothetical protein